MQKPVFSSLEPKAAGKLIIKTVIHLRHWRRRFFNDFFSETTGQISIKFHIQHPGNDRLKFFSDGPDLMAKMATMPIYGKNLKKNLLLQNRWVAWVDCLESWYVALDD